MNRNGACPFILGVLSLVLAIMMALTGCSSLSSKKNSPSSGQPSQQKSAKKTTVYYDFGDVLLPNQLSVDNSNSFVLSASGLTAGVLSLTGRVEVNSLVRFFESKMPNDGWRLVNKFRGLRNMLLFTKQNRNCVITIDETNFKTVVEIWVAPTIQDSESGLYK